MTTWALVPLGRIRVRRTVGVTLLVHLALVAVLRAVFGLALRTSDDAEMMAAVSGYDGGETRPELLFTNVLVGHALRSLYAVLPEAPWYGLYLHGLQAIAIAATVAAMLVLLEGRPRIAAVMVVGSIAALVPGFVLAVQFTIVAFLLATAGLLTHLALRRRGSGALAAGGIGGALMVMGLLVRFQSFAATLVVAASVLVLYAIAGRRWDLRGALALASVVGVLGGAAVALELGHWASDEFGGRPLPYLTSQLIAGVDDADADPERGLSGGGASGLSANDRALMAAWLIYPEMLGPDTSGGAATAGTTSAPVSAAPTGADLVGTAVSAIRGLLVPLVRDPVAFVRRAVDAVGATWWLAALTIPAILLAGDRHGRTAAAASLLVGTVLVGGISATRLPDRVLLPLLLLVLLGTIAVSAAGADRPRSGLTRAASLLAVPVLLVGAVEQARTAAVWIDERDWRQARATRFFDEIEELGVKPSDTVVLWLVDTWWVMDPLGWDQSSEYRDRTVQLAGWQYRLPYRVDQRVAYGVEDWIGAVADRDDVLLVAGSERVDRLVVLLRERRGRLCSEPVLLGNVRDGRDVVVRRIAELPCYGTSVQP